MKLVVDTNVLITFFWKNSTFNKIIHDKNLHLYAPAYALTEINKYAHHIQKKTGLSALRFKKLRNELYEHVQFMPFDEYASYFLTAQEMGKGLTKEQYELFLDDLDFIACAFAWGCPLWSNDKLLKEKTKIEVLTTAEVVLLL